MPDDSRAEVVIAGGGVAGLEALITLHDLARERVRVTLVAPGPDFVYRAMAISERFGLGARSRRPLDRVARDFGAGYVSDTVAEVDPSAAVLRCRSGREITYDSLIVALGARAEPAFEHTVTIGDYEPDTVLEGILADVELGHLKRLAFIAPSETVWSLPLYELALLTAEDAQRMGVGDTQLVVISSEERPLALFGPAAGEQLEKLLARRGIEFIGAGRPRVERGAVVIGGRRIEVDRTFALPLLRGPSLPGLPSDAHGFVPVDAHGRVAGLEGVFAAGDATTFPLKQGGIAAQQADAAGESVAARHGSPIEPAPFSPVLRGKLLTTEDELYLRTNVAGGGGEGVVAARALWWPPVRIAAQRLAPYLLGPEYVAQLDLVLPSELRFG